MTRTIKLGLFGLALSAMATSTAGAQTAETEAVVEGPGVALGEGAVFHPAISVETGVVSNVFYEDGDRANNDPVASAIARVVAGFSIASQTHKLAEEETPAIENEGDEENPEEPPPPAKVDFRFGAQAILNGYLSSNDNVQDQTDVGVGANGDVTFLPQGDFAVRLADEFLRDARPHNFESTGNLNRDYNHFMAGGTLQPQGRTISVGARYENTIDRFESDQADFANRLQHLIGLRGEWRLYPYTKFFADASYGFFDTLGDPSMQVKSKSNPLRLQVGVGTALTEVTTLRGYIGYANGFYDEGTNFSNVIGGAEFGYRYTQYGRFRIIADYNFRDSLQANFYRDYALLAFLDQQFGLFVFSADGGVRLRKYESVLGNVGGDDSRDDVLLSGAARLAYLLRDWLAITARFEVTVDQTDYTYMAGGITDSPEFTRYEAYLGVSAAF
jgi:hypothetical protein